MLTLMLSGCNGSMMSTLDPAGQAATDIAWISLVMMVGTGFFVLMMTVFWLHAVYRRGSGQTALSGRTIIILGGLVLPLVVVTALLVYGVRSGHSMLPIGEPDVRIRVTGHQWWWQFEYAGPDGTVFHTANELHLPVGQTIDLAITGADVIHAFWVPVLGGKLDAIPGHVNTLRLQPTRVGTFRGQCAEFCGAQHARMAFEVHVHEPADFDVFIDGLAGLTRYEAGEPAGRAAFQTHCADCHSLSTAYDLVGPNLATLPRRSALGAGTLPNTPESLRRWISHHQQIKPGNLMPDHAELDEKTVEVLAQLLESMP
ncbi:MAG: cytochrome c oxidase subunit II [Wenzhouxiangella sp.]